jgi:glucokinase
VNESDAILLADVGGTNVRFAVLDRAGLGPVAHRAVNDYQNFADGLAVFMALQPNNTEIRYALFGVAGVVEDGCCALTNNAWVVTRHSFARALDLPAATSSTILKPWRGPCRFLQQVTWA